MPRSIKRRRSNKQALNLTLEQDTNSKTNVLSDVTNYNLENNLNSNRAIIRKLKKSEIANKVPQDCFSDDFSGLDEYASGLQPRSSCLFEIIGAEDTPASSSFYDRFCCDDNATDFTNVFAQQNNEFVDASPNDAQNCDMDHEDDQEMVEEYLEDEFLDDKSETGPSSNRIIDPQLFLQLLKSLKHQHACAQSIQNIHLEKEIRSGLNLKFKVSCTSCNATMPKAISVNSENTNEMAVVGSMAAGIGFTGHKKQCDAINLPTMSVDSFRLKTHKVGKKVLMFARENMAKAAALERDLAIKSGSLSPDGTPQITVILDGCFCKRSYGSNYSSLSGGACVIGLKTGLILDGDVLNRYCHICRLNNKKQVQHDCSFNYSGPASGMESAIILRLFKRSVNLNGLKYNKYVGDGDSNTELLLSTSQIYNDVVIKKIECKNHLIRNFAKHLDVAITKNVNSKVRKPLLNNIHKITVALHFVIKNNKNKNPRPTDPETVLKDEIINVIHHYCGYHDKCGPKCNRKEETPICNRSILYLLEELTHQKLLRHMSSLLEGLDSNRVEQFHSIVAMFVGGKRINFSSSWGYTYRYFAAVLHFNEKDFMSFYLRVAFNEEPNTYMAQSLRFRTKQRISSLLSSAKLSKKRFLKRTTKKKGLEFYGILSKKPDMDTDILIESKKRLIRQLKLDQEKRVEIERDTRLQRDSDLWLLKRRNLLTASNFGVIINSRDDTLQNKVHQIKATFKPTPEMELGIQMESLGIDRAKTVIQDLKKIKDVDISSGGLFIDKKFYFLGASPDGIYQDILIEIKTAAAAWLQTIECGVKDKKIKCLEINKKTKKLQLKRQHSYYYQIQGQLQICDKNSCIFLIQTSNDFFYEQIFRDDNFWDTKMIEKLSNFWHFFSLELIDPRKERSMEVRKYKDYLEFVQSAEWIFD